MRLHPVLRFIYLLLRLLSGAAVSVFYRRRTVLGREHLHFEGPAIVVSNHPSTLMEPLNVGIHIRQEMFFLANYGLFKHPVSNWILTRLFCIPVKRREDVAEGEARDNDAAFEQSFKHLEKNGVLYIAAEGVSWMHRWVRDFKTGTARIAFGAESRHDWALGVKIIPVGLSYYAPNLFRSEMVIQYGEPMLASDWAAAWQQNPDQAVDDLTAELQRRVTALTIHTRDEEGERLIGHWEEIAHNEKPLPAEVAFRRSQFFTQKHLDDPTLRAKTDLYFHDLSSAGITDAGLAKQTSVRISRWQMAAEAAFLMVGFPLFALGWASWLLPCGLPLLLARRLGLYIGYDATVKVLVGFFTIPLGLWAATTVLRWAGFCQTWPTSLVWLVLVAAGLFAERYMDVWQRTWERWQAGRMARQFPGLVDALTQQRAAIVAQLHQN